MAKWYFQVSPRSPPAPEPPNIRNELSISIHAKQYESRAGGTVEGFIFIQSGKSLRRNWRDAAAPVPWMTRFESKIPERQSSSVVHIWESAEAVFGIVTKPSKSKKARDTQTVATVRSARTLRFPPDRKKEAGTDAAMCPRSK